MRLSQATASQLSPSVGRPQYDRTVQAVGIIHFGIGAFHRAHQAVYSDDAMNAGERDWAITGVSLRSASVAEQMNPQDGLYTVTQRSAGGDAARLIGSVANVLVASKQGEAVVAALAAPATHIASFTITEKGYCRTADGMLDLALADNSSAYAYLAAAFRARRDGGLGGLTLLSCDNLAGNGAQLQRLMAEYLERNAPDLRGWFDTECACPATMIDRIVPATTSEDRSAVAALIGMDDAAAIVTEPFSQWVIEDRFAGPRPSWENHGAQMTHDVAAYENAKLRMLNGAHSALAYAGLRKGHSFVHQAIADPELRTLVEALMCAEAAPSLIAAPGQDLAGYADALIDRFANPALKHRLIQIAMDGSQKIPQRWLETLAAHQQRGHQCPAILNGIAGWLCHVRGDNGAVDDPMASAIKAQWDQAGADGIVDALFGAGGLLASEWTPSESDKALIAISLNGAML